MKEKISRFFSGRQGMDELSKLLFWAAAVLLCLAWLLGGGFARLLLWIGLALLILSFVRAFSKRLDKREAENRLLLYFMSGKKKRYEAWRTRFSQRRSYRFFKCPGCGRMLRVPRGKGRIHIKCSCGYTLYRRT